MAPRKKRARADHQAAAEGLRETPALALTVAVCPAPYTAASLASDIQDGRYAYGPAGSYGARTETVDDGTAVLAWYITDTEQETAS
ncbi:hypothetical protein PV516_19150 [Streptomyces scabiei]|uniref:hypothetical protein n=1 Tax=Streptomyces scabiei TaxID=1930 RepID=UPI0029B3B907|nr:hypothetical protein [Streptomyces scabiei]MDX3165906.1 hypothetical protein [Streptomyces scabiei]